MINHLPECGYSPGQPGFGGINSGIPSTQSYLAPSPCICDELRACEQRIEEAMDRAWTQTVQLAEAHARVSAHRAALDAAREAVAAADPYWSVETDESDTVFVMEISSALAAIDALREKP